jgi:hypothetical protein
LALNEVVQQIAESLSASEETDSEPTLTTSRTSAEEDTVTVHAPSEDAVLQELKEFIAQSKVELLDNGIAHTIYSISEQRNLTKRTRVLQHEIDELLVAIQQHYRDFTREVRHTIKTAVGKLPRKRAVRLWKTIESRFPSKAIVSPTSTGPLVESMLKHFSLLPKEFELTGEAIKSDGGEKQQAPEGNVRGLRAKLGRLVSKKAGVGGTPQNKTKKTAAYIATHKACRAIASRIILAGRTLDAALPVVEQYSKHK